MHSVTIINDDKDTLGDSDVTKLEFKREQPKLDDG